MCLNPLYLRVDSTTFCEPIPILAPCCKCIECVIERQNSYKLRLCYEARRWKHCFFFTLTYRNSTLPHAVNYDTGEVISTCCKVHVRYWLKKMRERYLRDKGSRFEFRYFICSEYGSTDDYVDHRGRVRKATGRPHYHGIIFCNDSPEFVNGMFDEWRKSYGRVDFNELKPTTKCPDIREHRSKVANYVAKYCCKGEFSTRTDDIEKGYIEPSWFILSNGIGSNYVDDMKAYHLCQDGLFSNDVYRYLPSGPFTIDMVGAWFSSKRGTHSQKYAEKVWNYVNEVVDRMVVHDGNAPYKMPRYFRQKIYGTTKYVKRLKTLGFSLKFSHELCESFSQSFIHGRFCRRPEPYTYNSMEYEVKVPTSENFLSCAIAFVLRFRHDVRSEEEFREYMWSHRFESNSKALRSWSLTQLDKQEKRKNAKRSKLQNFYKKNHVDHPILSA